MKDGGFQAFLSRSSLLVERVLGRDETYNVFVDYSSRDGADRKRGDGSDAITPLVQVVRTSYLAELEVQRPRRLVVVLCSLSEW